MDQTFRIAGQIVTRSEMHDSKISFAQGLLRADHARGIRPRCLCRPEGVEMVVRRHPARFVLARMPDSGNLHDPSCESFDLPAGETGRGQYHATGIQIDELGQLSVTLEEPLHETRRRVASVPPEESIVGRSRSLRKPNKTTLLGLVHEFWSQAGLNKWHPHMQGKRGWWTVRKRINEIVQTTRVNQVPLSGRLWIPEAFKAEAREAQREAFRTFLDHATRSDGRRQPYALLLAPLAGEKGTKYGRRLSITHLKEFAFWMEDPVWDVFHRRFERDLTSLSDRSDGISVLCILILSAGRSEGNVNVVGGSAMRITRELIPVDSRYEVRIANALVQEGRAFIKPLRYDALASDVFPDFELLDVGGRPLPMEIYGFAGSDEYDRRKHEKLASYAASGRPFWHWDVATAGAAIGSWPPFPLASRPAGTS